MKVGIPTGYLQDTYRILAGYLQDTCRILAGYLQDTINLSLWLQYKIIIQKIHVLIFLQLDWMHVERSISDYCFAILLSL